MSEVLRDWGSCGRVVLVDDRPVGYVLYAPPAYLPGAGGFPTAPVSTDAVLLSAVYVAPAARGGGLGRMLVQGMARDLIERGGIAAVEAFGDTRGPGRPERAQLRDAGRLPDQRGVQDPARPRDHAADADGPAHHRCRGARSSRGRWRGCSAPSGPRPRPPPTTRGPRPVLTGRRDDRGAEPLGSTASRTVTAAQAMNSSSSRSSAAFGRAPTIDFTTSPPW